MGRSDGADGRYFLSFQKPRGDGPPGQLSPHRDVWPDAARRRLVTNAAFLCVPQRVGSGRTPVVLGADPLGRTG